MNVTVTNLMVVFTVLPTCPVSPIYPPYLLVSGNSNGDNSEGDSIVLSMLWVVGHYGLAPVP